MLTLREGYLTGTIEKVILDELNKAVAERFPLCKNILFSSRARGVAVPQSDLDLLVIVEADVDIQVKDYVSDCAWEAGFEYGIVVLSPFPEKSGKKGQSAIHGIN